MLSLSFSTNACMHVQEGKGTEAPVMTIPVATVSAPARYGYQAPMGMPPPPGAPQYTYAPGMPQYAAHGASQYYNAPPCAWGSPWGSPWAYSGAPGAYPGAHPGPHAGSPAGAPAASHPGAPGANPQYTGHGNSKV